MQQGWDEGSHDLLDLSNSCCMVPVTLWGSVGMRQREATHRGICGVEGAKTDVYVGSRRRVVVSRQQFFEALPYGHFNQAPSR